jgi:hypothetical protein
MNVLIPKKMWPTMAGNILSDVADVIGFVLVAVISVPFLSVRNHTFCCMCIAALVKVSIKFKLHLILQEAKFVAFLQSRVS